MAVLNCPSFDLVLGAGGIKGFGHLGLLKALEEMRIPVAQITGVSIGSIVAAFLANGFCYRQIRDILIEESDKLTFGGRPGQLLRKGIFRGGINLQSHAEGVVERYNLKPKDGLYIVAFDLSTMRPVYFHGTEYNLAEAVASSAAVPFFMRPVISACSQNPKRRKVLVDGACYHPYPATHCRGKTIISKVGQARYLPVRKMNPLDVLLQLGDMATGRFFSRAVTNPDHFLVDVGMPDVSGLCFGDARNRFNEMVEFGYWQALKVLSPATRGMCSSDQMKRGV